MKENFPNQVKFNKFKYQKSSVSIAKFFDKNALNNLLQNTSPSILFKEKSLEDNLVNDGVLLIGVCILLICVFEQ